MPVFAPVTSATRATVLTCPIAQTLTEGVVAPALDELRRPLPGRLRVGKIRHRSLILQARHSEIRAQIVRDRREAALLERRIERAVLLQHSCCTARPDPRGAGDPVGWVSAQGDEIRYLLGVDAVTLAHLVRPDAVELAHAPARL